jgi:hypothetical protein
MEDNLHLQKIVNYARYGSQCRSARDWNPRMDAKGLNLLIPDKPDAERDALAGAFSRQGGTVHRLDRFWEPPSFEAASVRVYGADSFCLVLPPDFMRRQLRQLPLGEVLGGSFPVFAKPTMPKQFRGAVYRSAEEIGQECRGLAPETPVFVAEVVSFTAEVRSFVLEGRVLDAAVYGGNADLAEAVAFVSALIPTMKLPRGVVVDVGFIVGRGWAVIEFNAAWGAGLNGCDPEKVLPAILAASSS